MAYGESRFSVASSKIFKRHAELTARQSYPGPEARAREALFVRMAESGFASPPIANLASDSLFKTLDTLEFRPRKRRNRFYAGSDWKRLKSEADQPDEATDAHLTESARAAARAKNPRIKKDTVSASGGLPVSESMIWDLVRRGQITEKGARSMLGIKENA